MGLMDQAIIILSWVLMAYGIFVAKRDEKSDFVFIYTGFSGCHFLPLPIAQPGMRFNSPNPLRP